MKRIDCPHCGARAQAEYHYERTLDSLVPLDMPQEQAMETLYTRTNPKGVEHELWCHSAGCTSWLVLERDRVSHDIKAVRIWSA
jgi:sarcosine oxidase, subunit delta